jgi:HEAT repeat protein
MIDSSTDRDGHSLHLLVWLGLRRFPTLALFQFLSDPDVIVRSAAARELQIRGGKRVFERTRQLLVSEKKNLRELAAFILGQLGTPKRPFKQESTHLLLKVLRSETNAAVRATAISSLGQLRATGSIKHIIGFAYDKTPSVRGSVAFAIGMIYCERRRSIPKAYWRLLQKFRKDKSREVREMAGLGIELVVAERQASG